MLARSTRCHQGRMVRTKNVRMWHFDRMIDGNFAIIYLDLTRNYQVSVYNDRFDTLDGWTLSLD